MLHVIRSSNWEKSQIHCALSFWQAIKVTTTTDLKLGNQSPTPRHETVYEYDISPTGPPTISLCGAPFDTICKPEHFAILFSSIFAIKFMNLYSYHGGHFRQLYSALIQAGRYNLRSLHGKVQQIPLSPLWSGHLLTSLRQASQSKSLIACLIGDWQLVAFTIRSIDWLIMVYCSGFSGN